MYDTHQTFIHSKGKIIPEQGQKIEGADLVPQKSLLVYIVEYLTDKKNPVLFKVIINFSIKNEETKVISNIYSLYLFGWKPTNKKKHWNFESNHGLGSKFRIKKM